MHITPQTMPAQIRSRINNCHRESSWQIIEALYRGEAHTVAIVPLCPPTRIHFPFTQRSNHSRSRLDSTVVYTWTVPTCLRNDGDITLCVALCRYVASVGRFTGSLIPSQQSIYMRLPIRTRGPLIVTRKLRLSENGNFTPEYFAQRLFATDFERRENVGQRFRLSTTILVRSCSSTGNVWVTWVELARKIHCVGSGRVFECLRRTQLEEREKGLNRSRGWLGVSCSQSGHFDTLDAPGREMKYLGRTDYLLSFGGWDTLKSGNYDEWMLRVWLGTYYRASC